MAALKEYPQFCLWCPKHFDKLLDRVIKKETKETSFNPSNAKNFSDIFSMGYYLKLSTLNESNSKEVYQKGYAHVKKLLAMESPFPIFVRMIACRFAIFLGYLSMYKPPRDDAVFVWREEFIELLNLFSQDSEASIRIIAWNTDIEQRIDVTEYNKLRITFK